ncbi:MAG TPA: alpha/beta fold hydrolase [Candidatus Cybelea sp.]|nr:alpha/beta fold hydrolase [Candidatus Cybelea sp.]
MREEIVAIGALQLDCEQTLAAVEQCVTIYGTPAADGSNVVLVEHALTGSSRAADWWPGIVGEGALFDPREWCVVGVNALGSCYGSTRTSARITVRDIVRAEMLALDELGFERVELAIGGSLGGMRALQWALDAPQRLGAAVLVGAHDHHSAMGIALNSLQREALALDPVRGLRLARKLAMLSYKSEDLFNERHGRRSDRHGRPCFDVEGYLDRQADLFETRMDAESYTALTHAMDSFDVRGAGDAFLQLGGVRKPALTFVGITADWLFRPEDVRRAAQRFALRGFDAQYFELRSHHGHDAFLAEPTALRALLEPLISTPAMAALRSSLC